MGRDGVVSGYFLQRKIPLAPVSSRLLFNILGCGGVVQMTVTS